MISLEKAYYGYTLRNKWYKSCHFSKGIILFLLGTDIYSSNESFCTILSESVQDSYCFNWKQQFEVKNVLMMDLFLTNTQLLTSQDNNWWTGVVWITCGLLWCFYQCLDSFWRHPFTAEHPLLRQWCNATFLQIWWRNRLIYIFDGLRVSKLSTTFFFGWTL